MLLANTNIDEDNFQQRVSSIRQLRANYLLMKSGLSLQCKPDRTND